MVSITIFFILINYSSKNNKKLENTNVWVLEIPKINLIANISEGTSKEVLENFIGHFEETRERIWKYSFSSS